MKSCNEALRTVQNGDIILQSAASIPIRPIEWLWDGWLAKGKLHILAGAPGTGKTTITMSLAAAVSASGRWPDGSTAPSGNVLIWSGEDDPADTLIPRLHEMGADLSRIHFISGVYNVKGNQSFDPAKDMAKLLINIEDLQPSLLIIDPIVSAVSGDSHKNSETRRGLQPLVDIAQSANLAVLGITHFSKGTSGREPIERITGSLAFGAMARVVFVAAKLGEDKGGGRLFCRAKSNIGQDSGGFKYDVEIRPFMETGETSVVIWGETLTGDTRQLLNDAEKPPSEDTSALSQAVVFLQDLLGNDKVGSVHVFESAKAAGHSRSAINRAKARLKIKPFAADKKWYWQLPSDSQDTQHTQQNMLDTLNTLSEEVGL